MTTDNLLGLFHHLHHLPDGTHKIHHCGGAHRASNPEVDYAIEHCGCGRHRIDKNIAIGHGTGSDGSSIAIEVRFDKVCPEGGWHIENGRI